MSTKTDSEEYAKLQDWITDINTKNFDDTKKSITETFFFKNNSYLYYLIDEIYSAMIIRPKSVTLLALLLKEFIAQDSTIGDFIKSTISDKVINITDTYSKDICAIVVLRLLFELEVFSFSEIIDIASKTKSVLIHSLIYLYFYGISKVISAPLIEFCLEKNLRINSYQTVNDILMVLGSDESTLEDLKQCIYCCYPRKSTEYAIKFDDVKMLQKIVSQSNHFNFEAKIKDTIFEYCPHVKGLRLAEYAAFCGSKKCFEYLRSNGADCTTALDYSVGSGDIEFIHSCIGRGEVRNNAIILACRLRQNVILRWALEQKHSISLKDCAEECIRSNNIRGLKIVAEKNFNLLELAKYHNPLVIAVRKTYFYMFLTIATMAPRIKATHEEVQAIEKDGSLIDINLKKLLKKREEKSNPNPVPKDRNIRR